MDETGHYITAERASTNRQTAAAAVLLSDLIPTMSHTITLAPEEAGGREVFPKMRGGGIEVEAPDNQPPTQTDKGGHMNMDAHYINTI